MKLTGKQIRELREAANLSQIEVEKLTGGLVHRMVLSFVENGHRTLSAEQEAAVCRVLTRAVRDRARTISKAAAQAERLEIPA